jgi:hypothetical protein
MKKCGNCKYRFFGDSYGGMLDSCIDYSMCFSEADEIEHAADCGKYEEGTPDCLLESESGRDEWDDLWNDRARDCGAKMF